MKLMLLAEGYGKVMKTRYGEFKVDPKPRVLVLGKWKHPSTRNVLVGGVNLNYLNDRQVDHLQKVLKRVLATRRLKDRYWRGRDLAPDIFNNYYRTYNKKYIHAVTPETLKFHRSPDEIKKDRESAKKGWHTRRQKKEEEPLGDEE